MNDDRDREIERLLKLGRPKVGIARRLKVSRKTVDRTAAAKGFPARRRATSRIDWEAVAQHYQAGHSAAACQRRFGFGASTWTAAISRGDIVPRPRDAQLPPGRRRLQVAELLEQGLGIADIARKLGVSKPTVCYHARKLGVPPRSQFALRFDWDEIQAVHDSGISIAECRRRFGFSRQAWSDAVKRGSVVPRGQLIPLAELLVTGRNTSRTHLKKRLLSAGLKENRCESCGIDSWEGRPLSLQLHHVNGEGSDNRLENLEFLCPNCHSQTGTGAAGTRSGGPVCGSSSRFRTTKRTPRAAETVL